MAALQDLFLKNATEDEVVAIATAYCIDMKIEDELVCTAVVLEFKVLVHVGIVRRLWTLRHPLSCRYDSTVVNQFFGHSHTDHFEVFFDLENKTRATK